jgi:hypothetical protein
MAVAAATACTQRRLSPLSPLRSIFATAFSDIMPRTWEAGTPPPTLGPSGSPATERGNGPTPFGGINSGWGFPGAILFKYPRVYNHKRGAHTHTAHQRPKCTLSFRDRETGPGPACPLGFSHHCHCRRCYGPAQLWPRQRRRWRRRWPLPPSVASRRRSQCGGRRRSRSAPWLPGTRSWCTRSSCGAQGCWWKQAHTRTHAHTHAHTRTHMHTHAHPDVTTRKGGEAAPKKKQVRTEGEG